MSPTPMIVTVSRLIKARESVAIGDRLSISTMDKESEADESSFTCAPEAIEQRQQIRMSTSRMQDLTFWTAKKGKIRRTKIN
jgi:hypothetical protein